jgi:hypothetical protein
MKDTRNNVRKRYYNTDHRKISTIYSNFTPCETRKYKTSGEDKTSVQSEDALDK